MTQTDTRIETVMSAKALLNDPMAENYYRAEAAVKTMWLRCDRAKLGDAYNTALEALEESRQTLDDLWRWLCAVQSVIDRFALPVESLPQFAERVATERSR